MLNLLLSALSVVVVTTIGGASAQQQQRLVLPRLGIQPNEIAVVANTDVVNSTARALLYAQARGIPSANVLSVALGTAVSVSASVFEAQYNTTGLQLPPGAQASGQNFQAIALVFSFP